MPRQQLQNNQILSQIQSSLRRKKQDYETFLGVNSLQLPPIANLTITFPLSRPNRKKNPLIYTPKKDNSKKGIDNIMSFNNIHQKNITNKEGYKIIDGLHVNNLDPISDRTGVATNLNLSVQQNIVKNSYHSYSTQKKQRRYKQQQFTAVSESLQLSRSDYESEKSKLSNYLTVKQSPPIRKVKNGLIIDFLPKYSQTRVNKITRFQSDFRQLKKDNVNVQRYSPWRINQEEQLII